LTDIDEDAMSSFHLALGVVTFEPWFANHLEAASQAGFRRCCNNAAAASSPRPPACATST
jgi:hypothetical protein